MWLMVTRLMSWYDAMLLWFLVEIEIDTSHEIENRMSTESIEWNIHKQAVFVTLQQMFFCGCGLVYWNTQRRFWGGRYKCSGVNCVVMQFDVCFDCYFHSKLHAKPPNCFSKKKKRNSTNFYLITKFIRVVLDGRKKVLAGVCAWWRINL